MIFNNIALFREVDMTPQKLVKITSIIHFQTVIWLFHIQIAMNSFDLFLSSAPMPKLVCKN